MTRTSWLACAAILLAALSTASRSQPPGDERAGLPAGTELDEDTIRNPREIFHSEATHGRRSYLSSLGNLAFNSPYILGPVAQRAHLSCGTCHVNGASNPRLFVPGLSTRAGNFDTTSALFNPKTDNGVLDPLTIPSLRGARYLAPYGHDGRALSLRDFVRSVIVGEFGGSEPSGTIDDALVVYIQDIDFLPNPAMDGSGRLLPGASAAQRRGELLFNRPFPHDQQLSCSGCHVPSGAFVDHRQHDVGSGGLYKTPTLVNADFNAPYFHDGRFDTYAEVIDYFDSAFSLDYSPQEKADLIAYLQLAGDGVRPDYPLTGNNVLEDINGFASVLELAISNQDREVIDLAVRTVSEQLHDLADRYPDPAGDADTSVRAAQGGKAELALARGTLGALRDVLRGVQSAASTNRFDEASVAYLQYRKLALAAAPMALRSAERWSLFDPALHAAHRASMHPIATASAASH